MKYLSIGEFFWLKVSPWLFLDMKLSVVWSVATQDSVLPPCSDRWLPIARGSFFCVSSFGFLPQSEQHTGQRLSDAPVHVNAPWPIWQQGTRELVSPATPMKELPVSILIWCSHSVFPMGCRANFFGYFVQKPSWYFLQKNFIKDIISGSLRAQAFPSFLVCLFQNVVTFCSFSGWRIRFYIYKSSSSDFMCRGGTENTYGQSSFLKWFLRY